MTGPTRSLLFAGAGAVVLIAIALGLSLRSSPAGAPPARQSPSPQTSSGQPPASAGKELPSALRDPGNEAFAPPLIDLDDLVAGGPPPDGIPPIDKPRFESVDEVTWLGDTDPVLSLTVDGETRGYPVAIMTWHEIVNDEIDGTPVAVTYCPLCNSGVAFRRVVDGQRLDFGTSGMLYADNLVMYDRQTQSLWPQLTGLASVGAMTGTQLEAIPMGAVGWAQFREAHPDARVLTRETGHDRDYGANPYVGYDEPDGALLVPVPGGTDDRLLVKARVVGLGEGAGAVAVTRDLVSSRGVLEVSLDGQEVSVWHMPGQASALDEEQIAESRDVGSVVAYSPRVRGRDLTWRRSGAGFVDTQTGSRWNIAGEAVSGPLRGARLEPVRHLDTFWFAWVAFQPDTRLIG
ncbi:MAG: DUF3179 domain-containing protein [Nocardioides sp.]